MDCGLDHRQDAFRRPEAANLQNRPVVISSSRTQQQQSDPGHLCPGSGQEGRTSTPTSWSALRLKTHADAYAVDANRCNHLSSVPGRTIMVRPWSYFLFCTNAMSGSNWILFERHGHAYTNRYSVLCAFNLDCAALYHCELVSDDSCPFPRTGPLTGCNSAVSCSDGRG